MQNYDSRHVSKSMLLATEVVAAIEQVFTTPPQYQEPLLAMMLQNSSDGFLFLNILSNMVQALAGIPIDYIRHCIDRTENSLELSADELKVRLRRLIPPSTIPSDRFGNMYGSDLNVVTNTDPEVPCKEAGDYYVQYAPRFQHLRTSRDALSSERLDMDDERARMKLTPILYRDGSFVIDNQIGETRHNLSQDLVPRYKRDWDKTIGDTTEDIQSSRCFNCNSPEHSFNQCPEPRNAGRIRANRKQYVQDEGRAGTNSTRFFVELGIREAVAGFQPGKLSQRLQQAMGIHKEEPPYYRNMRERGYPPGYLKYADEHLLDNDSENEPLLAIYDGSEVQYADKQTGGISMSRRDAQAILLQQRANLVQKRRKLPKTQTVTYPGLNLPSSSDAEIEAYYQDQTQQALNNAIPKQAYYATNAMLSNDPTNMSIHVPTQAVVDNDDEEDMDISD